MHLSTLHSSKGLDFPVVLLFLHRPPFVGGGYADEDTERMVRSLLYVSITRPMDHLNVFCCEKTTSRAILDLIDTFARLQEEDRPAGKG